MAATCAEIVIITPAEAARAPEGCTYTATGMAEFKMPFAISLMARSNPPGVSRRMIRPSEPAFADASMLCRIYSAIGGVMAAWTVMVSKTGFFSSANNWPGIGTMRSNARIRIGILILFLVMDCPSQSLSCMVNRYETCCGSAFIIFWTSSHTCFFAPAFLRRYAG